MVHSLSTSMSLVKSLSQKERLRVNDSHRLTLFEPQLCFDVWNEFETTMHWNELTLSRFSDCKCNCLRILRFDSADWTELVSNIVGCCLVSTALPHDIVSSFMANLSQCLQERATTQSVHTDRLRCQTFIGENRAALDLCVRT